MAPKKVRLKPGPPARYGRRPTLTIRLQEPLYRTIKKSAAQHGKSLSEEIEDRLGRDAGWEETKADINKMKAEAAAQLDAARVHAYRAAGLQILREIEGRPTRVVIDLETLLAEADGIARGLRSGFEDKNHPPAIEPPRPMTAEESQRLMEEIEAIKRRLEAAMEKTRSADAAASDKSGDEAA
jgi:hypothetical protein